MRKGRHIYLALLWIGVLDVLKAQSSWSGSYSGTFNGDRVEMQLSRKENFQIKGTLKDSYSEYEVNAVEKKDTLRGNAKEKTLGLVFELFAVRKGEAVNMILSLDFLGTIQKLDIQLYKNGAESANATSISQGKGSNPVSSKSRDAKIAGSWVKESNYSSGYGSNGTYGAMSSQETMVFYQDGTMANGPSSTVIGGSNYSGTSVSGQTNKIEGLYWYNQGNRLFLYSVQQGKAETIELGTYYIENNHMLITGANGTKMLLSRR